MVNLGSLMPNVGSVASYIKTLLWALIIGGSLGGTGFIVRNKVKYKYVGEIFKRRQEDFETNIPQSKNISGKAGYFKKKRGKTVFRIKYGIMPWQQIELSKLPDPKYMVGNKVYYLQLNKDNLVQAKMTIDWDGKMNLQPIEDDLKYGAQLDLLELDQVLETKRLNPVTVGMMIMGIIIVTGIIVFYFLGKA
jgi:hypothetical protein